MIVDLLAGALFVTAVVLRVCLSFPSVRRALGRDLQALFRILGVRPDPNSPDLEFALAQSVLVRRVRLEADHARISRLVETDVPYSGSRHLGNRLALRWVLDELAQSDAVLAAHGLGRWQPRRPAMRTAGSAVGFAAATATTSTGGRGVEILDTRLRSARR